MDPNSPLGFIAHDALRVFNKSGKGLWSWGRERHCVGRQRTSRRAVTRTARPRVVEGNWMVVGC